MGHIKLKSTIEIKTDFKRIRPDKISIPEKSKSVVNQYLNSKNLAQDSNFGIFIMLDDKMIAGYDYIHNGKKLILPEVNPVTIFFSNAVMSNGMLRYYKEKMLSEASEAGNIGQNIRLDHSCTYFQLAANCIVNLQATIENYANGIIPENHIFIDKTGKTINPTIGFKLYNTVPKIKLMDFKQAKYKRHNKSIDKLIKLRNDIIHLKPTNSADISYKETYRELLDFDFERAIIAVKTYINFYDSNLIEECECGLDFCFDVIQKSK